MIACLSVCMRRPLWERTDPVIPKFHYDPEHDTNDDKEWSEMDFEDLQNSLARGGSVEDVAIFLCRRGRHRLLMITVAELARYRWDSEYEESLIAIPDVFPMTVGKSPIELGSLL